MERQLRVTHAEGEDLFPGPPWFGIEEGVLLIYSDRGCNELVRAYNREVWAYVGYEEVA